MTAIEPGSQYPGKELEAMSFAVNYHRWILDCFTPYLGRDIAEVGAGIGSITRMLCGLPERKLVAFEPSNNMFPQLAQAVAGVTGARAVNDFFRPGHAPGGLDSVLYINVLEHVEDDLSELRLAYASLRPGGYLLVFVPALPWLYSEFDQQIGHFRRYTKNGLWHLATDAGFQVRKLRYFDLAGIIPWYVSFVLLKGSPKSTQVALYDRYVVPIMRRLESLVPPPIGKNLLLVAQKS